MTTSAGVTPGHALQLLAAAVLYGGIFPVNRMAAEAGWPPLAFAFAPALVAGVLLIAAGVAGRQPLAVGGRHIMAFAVIGGLVIGLPMGILVTAASHLPASTVTLVLCLSPILTLAIAAGTGSERFDSRVLGGMVLGTAGIALIVWPESGIVGAGNVRWFLIALLAPVLFALANNAAVWLRPPAASSLVMSAGTLLGGAVVAALVALPLGAPLWPAAPGAAAAVALLLAAVINAGFFLLFFHLIGTIGAARFSIFNYLAVAAGIVWSMIAFGEIPQPLFWVAAALMLGGMYLALRPARG